MSNLSILEQNVLLQFGDCDISQAAFLKALAIAPLAVAERFAQEVHQTVSFLRPALQSASRNFGRDDYDPDLLDFLATRHWHWRKPDLTAARDAA